MNKIFITLFSLLTILAFFYFGGVISFYKQTLASTDFNGANSLIAFDSKGNITSIPVSNINTGINDAIKGTATSLSSDIRANTNNLSYLKNTTIPSLAKRTDVARRITSATRSLATKGELNNYVKKGSPISIQVGRGSSGYTYSDSDPRYLYASSDNWRVAYRDTKPNAKFIIN